MEDDIQPIESQLKGRIMNLFDEAKDRAFSSYRAMFDSSFSIPGATDQTHVDIAATPSAVSGNNPVNVLETFYQPPPSRPLSDSFSLPEPGLESKHEQNKLSEFGYVCSSSGGSSSEHVTLETTESNITMTSGSQSQPALEWTISEMGQSSPLPVPFSNIYNLPMPSHGGATNTIPRYPDDIWTLDSGNLDLYGFDWAAPSDAVEDINEGSK